MKLTKLLVPIGCLALLAVAFNTYGWRGLAVVGGGITMWLLLHFTRMMTVLKRASDRPVGYVGSAVMLNAKLKPGVNLLHVVAMTRSLGQQLDGAGTPRETYRWTDGSESYVDCVFESGKLQEWQLTRPQPKDADAITSAP
ncbi:glycerate kinase [Xylophilus rhododendri]|uniref:Glycerate kinase n=1 Tax=Xylophilus rhododendri TaxID=2697032 RepID=A0A857J7P7_9BURK|nr:glycerate kinase [Xylophilus rhododendri]QHI99032.1 glycerate kinase [Xylophilus rhododendri]